MQHLDPLPLVTGVRQALLCAIARRVSAVMIIAALFAAPGVTSANPTGASVANGSAAFATPNASTLNITTSNGAIINWQQFGINPGEVTRFLQQGANAAVLNRVVGGDPSAILGSLLSNGRVFLINPNGVLFGANAIVDTAGLVVSTLNMSDEDFINGRLHFEGDGASGAPSGAIVNQGQIRSQGSVILIAPRIENSGLIETEHGGLLLAAGREVTITSYENPEIAYQLQAPENEVVNLGQLIAHGGAASVFAGTIRHSGDINANSVIVGKDGRVQLVASGAVTLEAGSTISADGANGGEILVRSEAGDLSIDSATLSAIGADGAGGQVALLGREVTLSGGTRVDVSGRSSGGEILVGGDYQGANPDIANASNTRVGATTALIADASGNGDGGKVIVWSDGVTRSAGRISARGGSEGGNGGFVEVSGKQALGFSSQVDTLAPQGSVGTLLLDPTDIVVATGGGAPLTGVDNAGDPDTGPGCDSVDTCTIDPAAINGAGAAVTLQASRDIFINNAISIVASGVSFTAQANNDIVVDAPITTNNADIILQANQTNNGPASGIGSVLINNAINSTGGAVIIDAGDAIVMDGAGAINAGSGNVDLLAVGGTVAGDIVLTNIATTGNVRVVNQNANAGSGILQSLAGTGGTTGLSVLLEVEKFVAGGTIGTLAKPMRIGGGVQLESHAHDDIDIIAIKGLGDLTIGNGGAGAIKGIQIVGAGDIDVNVAGTLTLLAPGGGLEGPVQTGGNTGDDITLSAVNGISINASIDADTEPVTLNSSLGAIVQSATGDITAGKLKVISHSGITLNAAANSISQLTADNTANNNIDFANTGGPLSLSNNVTAFAVRNQAAGGEINIKSVTGISVADEVTTTGNVSFDASGGSISQSAAGKITASVLNIINSNGANLSGALNNVIGLSGSSIIGGGLVLLNDSGGSALGLNNISLNANLSVTNSGGISVIDTVNAGSANSVTLVEQTSDINSGGGKLQDSTVFLTANVGGIGNGTTVITDAVTALNLNSGGAGAAGNVDVKELNAFASSALSISTDGASAQAVKFATDSGDLTVNSSFGDAQDDLTLHAIGGFLQGSSGTVTAQFLTLRGGSGVNLTNTVFTAATGASVRADTGNVSMSSPSSITSTAGPLSLVADTGSLSVGNVSLQTNGDLTLEALNSFIFMGSGGSLDAGSGLLKVTAQFNVTLPGISAGRIEITSNAGDVILGAGQPIFATATGLAPGTPAITLNAPLGDVRLDLVGGGPDVTTTSGGLLIQAGDEIDFDDGDDGNVIYNIAGDITARSTGGDVIGDDSAVLIARNVVLDAANEVGNTGGSEFTINASGFVDIDAGTSATYDVISAAGAVTIDVGNDIFEETGGSLSGASIALRSTGVFTLNQDLSNVGNILVKGDAGLNIVARNITSSGGQVTLDGGTGIVLVEGGPGTGDSAKIQALTTVTVTANDVTVKGGSGSGAFASIDPNTVVINAANNILVQSGPTAGSNAQIVASNLVNLNAGGNIDIIGDAESAVVESIFGDVNLIAGGGVSLIAGAGSFADAVIAANSGLGTVNITSASCANCVLLGFDPFANAVPDQGIFAAALNFLSPPSPPAPSAQDDSVELNADDVLVLEELAEQLASQAQGDDGNKDDDEDRRMCI